MKIFWEGQFVGGINAAAVAAIPLLPHNPLLGGQATTFGHVDPFVRFGHITRMAPARCGILSGGSMAAGGSQGTGGRGPRLVSYDRLPSSCRMHPLVATAINEEYPKTTARISGILERLLSHPRFEGYDEEFTFLLTDRNDAASSIYMLAGGSTILPYNVVVLSNGLLHRLISKGAASDDRIAFILSHELVHVALRKEGYDMGDPLRPNHHIEDQADIQALRLMDDCGYSVRFAGFDEWIDDLGRNFRLGLLHPDAWWRDVRMDKAIDEGHFGSYSERATGAFSDDEVAEAISPAYRTRIYRSGAALFGRTDLLTYVDGVESVENGEEALLHISNLFMHYAVEDARRDARVGMHFGDALRTAREHFEKGGYIPYFDVDRTAVDLAPFLDRLAGSQISIMEQFAGDDAVFRFYDLPDGTDERKKRKLKILNVYLGSLAFAEHVARLKWEFMHGGRMEKANPEILQSFEGEFERLMHRIASINPRLKPLTVFLERSFLDRNSVGDLRFSYAEAADFLGLYPVREHLFVERKMNPGIFGNMPRLPGDILLDVPYTAASSVAIHMLLEMLHRTRPRSDEASPFGDDKDNGEPDVSAIFDRAFSEGDAAPSRLKDLLVLRAAAEDPMRDLLFKDYHFGIRIPDAVRISIRSRYDTAQIARNAEDAVLRGDVADVIFWMGCLEDGEGDDIILGHFDFFESRARQTFRQDLLRLMCERRDVRLPRGVKSGAAARLYRLLDFFCGGKAGGYRFSAEAWRQSRDFNDRFLLSNLSLLWEIEDDRELAYLAGLYLDRFDSILKSIGSMYGREEGMPFLTIPGPNVPLILYVALRLIKDGRLEEFRALAEDPEDGAGAEVFPFAQNSERFVSDFAFDYLGFDGAYLIPPRRDSIHEDDEPPEYGFKHLDDEDIEAALKRLYSIASGERKGIPFLISSLQKIYLERLTGATDDDLRIFIGEDGKPSPILLRSCVAYDENFHPAETPMDIFDDLDDPSTEEGQMHARLVSLMDRTLAGRSDIGVLYVLPPEIAMRFIDRILPDERPAVEDVRRISEDLRHQKVDLTGEYVGEANLHPDERIAQMSVGDYVAFHYMPKDLATYEDLIAYMNDVWRFKSQLRDVAIIRFMKAHEPSHRDVARIVPYMQMPERISVFSFDACRQFLTENPSAGFGEALEAIAGFFPKASRDRDVLMLETARRHPIGLETYRLLSGYLGEEKRIEAEEMYVEQVLGLVGREIGATVADRVELLLWLLGISEEFPPNFVAVIQRAKTDREYLKRILQVPAERESLFKMLLIGSDGILLPHNVEARRMFLDRIWKRVFPAPSKLERLCLDLLDIALSEVRPYRQYKIVSALVGLVYDRAQQGGDVSIDDIVPALLGACGVEGVKLAQIFSSYGGLWEREPTIARRLSDFQDESDLMHQYYLFRHLLGQRGEDGVRHLKIQVPRRAGSIKGFFTGEDVRTGGTFGLLFLRPQASKDLMENRDSLERILRRAEPLIREAYGADVPDGLPAVVFGMVGREVEFEHERRMAAMLGGGDRGDGGFAYPRLASAWQTPVVIGVEYVHPHVSMKRLLALEGDAGEWNSMTQEERDISLMIAGLKGGERFDHRRFVSAVQYLKFGIIERILVTGGGRAATHLDPHPGNILISVEDGRIVIFMTDLGAVVEMSPEDASFIRDATSALIEDDEERLKHAALARFGDCPIDCRRVMGTPYRFRSIVLREELKRNGAEIPETLEEYMFSLVKLDRLIPRIDLDRI